MTEQVAIEGSDDAPVDLEDLDGLDDVATVRPTVNEWLSARTLPQILLTCAVLLWTAYFTQRSLDIHHGLGTSSYDSGLYDQGMWLLSRGEAPFVTLMGRNMFGDHTSFVLLLLVPLYWIAPGAWIMFFSQSAVIAAGAIPVFCMVAADWSRNGLRSLPRGHICCIRLSAGPTWRTSTPTHSWGSSSASRCTRRWSEKWKLYGAFVVLSLLVKEDVSLVIVPLGIWVALRRSWRIGLITVFGSLWFMFTAMYVVMRGLIGQPTLNAWRIPFSQPGDGTGAAARRLIDTAVTNPTQLADHLRADGRPWYLWQMTSPFAWIFLRLPSVAMISALVLFTNVLSTFWYQYQVQYHYALVAVPALAIGTVYALGAVKSKVTVQSLEVPLRAVGIGALALSSFCLRLSCGRRCPGAGPCCFTATRTMCTRSPCARSSKRSRRGRASLRIIE